MMYVTLEEIMQVAHERDRWSGIVRRCKHGKWHGDRGIKVCDEWSDGLEGFARYYEHVSNLPHFGEEGYSLDRINNDGDYEPGNVRWATHSEQNYNRRCTRKDGNQNLQEIAETSNLPISVVRSRWKCGKRGDELRKPVDEERRKNALGKNRKRVSEKQVNSTEE